MKMEDPSSYLTKATNSDPGWGSESGSPKADFLELMMPKLSLKGSVEVSR